MVHEARRRLSRLSRGPGDILRGEVRVELEADERRRRAASSSLRHGILRHVSRRLGSICCYGGDGERFAAARIEGADGAEWGVRTEEAIADGRKREAVAPPTLRARRSLPLPVPPHGQCGVRWRGPCRRR